MELTLDQALQKGIEAHKAGKVQEADRYYTAILQANPKHPDANHNMGVLAVGVGKVEEALPFYKTALEVKPNIAQYWLSYVDALIKLDQIDEARTTLEQARSIGVKADGLDQIEKKLNQPSSQNPEVQDPQPPNNLFNKAVELRESGKFDEAIDLLKDGIGKAPKDANLYALLSHCYILNNAVNDAANQLAKARELDPNIASVGWNETRLLLKQKKVDEALSIAQKTNRSFPDDIEGMGILGLCLRANGHINELSLIHI